MHCINNYEGHDSMMHCVKKFLVGLLDLQDFLPPFPVSLILLRDQMLSALDPNSNLCPWMYVGVIQINESVVGLINCILFTCFSCLTLKYYQGSESVLVCISLEKGELDLGKP